MVKQDKNRSKRIYRLVQYQCMMALKFGEVFLSDESRKLRIFLNPEKEK